MKQIVLLLVVVSAIGCTKEKEPNSLTGTWRLTQINSSPPASSVYLYGTELSIEFKAKDTLVILGPKPNYTYLQEFNRYQIINNDRIRFFNTSTQDELFAVFSLDKTLSLSYELRCPYEEKFVRR
jgi:hypothetical protein